MTTVQLPAELWMIVISYIEDIKGLLYLATFSRNLYQPCLTQFLVNLGNVDPTRSITVHVSRTADKPCDAFTALRLPFFMDETEELICTIPGSDALLLSRVTRLQSAVSRLRRMKRVVLTFPGLFKTVQADNETLRRWSDTFSLLLNSIVERGCESVEVHGLTEMTDCYRLVNRVFRKRGTSSGWPWLASLWRGITQGPTNMLDQEDVMDMGLSSFERHRILPPDPYSTMAPRLTLPPNADVEVARLSKSARANTQLTHIVIASMSLINPPLLQWLHSVMLASPIESLTVSNLTPYNEGGFAWSFFCKLALISVPNLKRIAVTSLSLRSFTEFNTWLSSFNDLMSLEISRIVLPWSYPLSADRPMSFIFPNITLLCVSTVWLEASAQPDLAAQFPQLKKLELGFEQYTFRNLTQGWIIHDMLVSMTQSHRQGQLPFTVALRHSGQPLEIYRDMAHTAGMEEWGGCVTGIVLGIEKTRQDYRFDDSIDIGMRLKAWTGKFKNLSTLRIVPAFPNKPVSVDASRHFGDAHVPASVIKRLELFEVNGVAKRTDN